MNLCRVSGLGGGSLTRNKVQHTAVLQLYDFIYICQRVVTGDSYVFYSGIYLRCRVNASQLIAGSWLHYPRYRVIVRLRESLPDLQSHCPTYRVIVRLTESLSDLQSHCPTYRVIVRLSESHVSTEVVLPSHMILRASTPCADRIQLNKIETTFDNQLRQKVNEFYSSQQGSCAWCECPCVWYECSCVW